MMIGDLVIWKYRSMSQLPSEFGIVVCKIKVEHDPWPFWAVLFGARGILTCRESDIEVWGDENR